MSPIEVLESPYARIEIDRSGKIVRLARTSLPLDPAALEHAVDDLQKAIPLRERSRLVMLQDMRLGRLIRDDAVEEALVRVIPRMYAGFAARAVLMASAVGMLQAKRFAHTGGVDARLFYDEGEALRYLASEVAKLRAVK